MNSKLAYYNAVKDLMTTMDLLSWRSRSVVGKIIRAKTGGQYNHTGVVMRFPSLDGPESRRWTLEAVGKGMSLNFLSRALEHHHGEVYWQRVRPGFEKEAIFAASWMMEQVGVPYDYGNLFKNIFGKTVAEAGALFCSEAVFLGWQFAAIHLGIKALNHILSMKTSPVPAEMPEVFKTMYEKPSKILEV